MRRSHQGVSNRRLIVIIASMTGGVAALVVAAFIVFHQVDRAGSPATTPGGATTTGQSGETAVVEYAPATASRRDMSDVHGVEPAPRKVIPFGATYESKNVRVKFNIAPPAPDAIRPLAPEGIDIVTQPMM